MDRKELFEEIYAEVLFDNIDYKRVANEGNKLVSKLMDYMEFKVVSEADNAKELLVYEEMLKFLINTIDIFISVHKIKDKRDKKLIIKGLKDRFEKVEKEYRNTSEKYQTEREKYINADKKLMVVINDADKDTYIKLSDIESDRFLLEIDLMFEVMLKFGKFLYGIQKIKIKNFFEKKKTPEQTEI